MLGKEKIDHVFIGLVYVHADVCVHESTVSCFALCKECSNQIAASCYILT